MNSRDGSAPISGNEGSGAERQQERQKSEAGGPKTAPDRGAS
jgi:hypothetical protein